MSEELSPFSPFFQRNRLLLGDEPCRRLNAARVAIVGLGAVGFQCAETLTRMGVGGFLLVDFDIIRESNFNRHMLALTSTLGQPKIGAAQRRLLDINPQLKLETLPMFCHGETFDMIFREPVDLVIDAIDSFSPKVRLLEMAVKRGFPVISSMGAARRRDPFAIRAADISETRVCPLAFRVRKELRKYGVAGGVRCVYSEEPPSPLPPEPPSGIEPEHYSRGRPRSPIGSLGYITAIFGCVIAAEAMRILTAPTEPPPVERG